MVGYDAAEQLVELIGGFFVNLATPTFTGFCLPASVTTATLENSVAVVLFIILATKAIFPTTHRVLVHVFIVF